MSCGCARMEKRMSNIKLKPLKSSQQIKPPKKTKHPLFQVLRTMKNKCYSPKCKQYKDYGGRGIFICQEWLNDEMSFYNWAINNGYKRGLQIDRKENNDGYYPSNCRFVPPAVNMMNRRNSVFLIYMGKRVSVSELSKIVGIKGEKIRSRIFVLGWSLEKAVSKQ